MITVLATPQVPAHPDRRGLIKRGFLALLIGALLGFLVAAWREYLGGAEVGEPDVFGRFLRLRGEVRDDLRRPWRFVGRLVRPRARS